MTFYAVANGRSIGIFLNWNDCNNSVKGYKNALYKKFDTKEEADNFIFNILINLKLFFIKYNITIIIIHWTSPTIFYQGCKFTKV